VEWQLCLRCPQYYARLLSIATSRDAQKAQ
jgi:hypothetical protein